MIKRTITLADATTKDVQFIGVHWRKNGTGFADYRWVDAKGTIYRYNDKANCWQAIQ